MLLPGPVLQLVIYSTEPTASTSHKLTSRQTSTAATACE
jgi:hypothetical protein